MQNTDSTKEREETQPVSPRVSCLDPTFKYVDSAATDIRKTFERVRAEMAKAKPANVRTIKRQA